MAVISEVCKRCNLHRLLSEMLTLGLQEVFFYDFILKKM